jgi:hypothetical protein
VYFDGSDVAVTASTEKVDAVARSGCQLDLATTGASPFPASRGRLHLRADLDGTDHGVPLATALAFDGRP